MTVSPTGLDDVMCIVVHYRSPGTLMRTLDAIVAGGVPSSRILVVDNSGDDGVVAAVEERGAKIRLVPNRGYAAAANEGLRLAFDDDRMRCPFVVVSTHESLPAPDALRRLRDAMAADPTIAVAGPTLWDATREHRIWSRGGYLTKRLALARHHVAEEPSSPGAAVDRDWLDGAFTMYRSDDLRSYGFDESYFLYFEETDLHTRLRRGGHRVVWVPEAHASQITGGTPARLLGRNLFLFHSRFFSVWQGRSAVMFEAARAMARFVLTRRGDWRSSGRILAGWLDGERLSRGKPTRVPYPSEDVAS